MLVASHEIERIFVNGRAPTAERQAPDFRIG